LGALIVLLLAAGPAWGAGSSVTFTGDLPRDAADRPGGGLIYTITATVLSDDSDGSATGTTGTSFHGVVMSVESDPGSTAPTTLWDYTATDHSGGADLLNGGGTDRSATVTQSALNAGGDVLLAAPINGPLTFTFSNMGNAKTATIRAVVWE
jgi:hypothetical protein